MGGDHSILAMALIVAVCLWKFGDRVIHIEWWSPSGIGGKARIGRRVNQQTRRRSRKKPPGDSPA